ncbi:portal protein [Paenibacillus anseongense]|uniref:portal protein n=1 Tax=Paenibacillus anseongense TaxID=2682845 RepID=UPI002DB63F2B|nr:hypothetical protein [Paenibacillus anseongense]MEC0265144.1 hypothetical protein [Paenibacillus anseongense]
MSSIIDDEFKTNSDTYEQLRQDLMTEDEIKEANKYIEWFKSSYKDKDRRGLFERWETVDAYWEGEAHQPESDSDPASNTNIINSNVEGQVAYLVEQEIDIMTTGTEPSDVPFADVTRTILHFIKDKNKMKRKLDVHERRREKFGTGIFRVLFDPDLLDGMGLPVIEPCNPAYIFPDPTITDIYKVQEGRFLIEIINKSLNWARDNFDEDLVDAIQPAYHPMEYDDLFGEDDGQTDVISRDSYLHFLVWSRYKDKDGKRQIRLVQMSGCGVILKDSRNDSKDDEEEVDEEKRFYPLGLYPYFFTPDMFREGTVWAKGSAELLIGQQNTIDDIEDQIIINARLTGNPQRLILTDSGIDPDKVTNEGGLSIPSDIPDGMKYINPAQMPQYVIQHRQSKLNLERQIVSRWSDQMNGIQQRGVDTATEVLSLQQSGNAGINHKKLLLQETLSEVFDYCLELVKDNWTEEEAFKVTGKENDFVYFNPSKLKAIPKLMPASNSYQERFLRDVPGAIAAPQHMPLYSTDDQGQMIYENGQPKPVTKNAKFDISVTVGAGLPSNLAFRYNILKESYMNKALTLQEYRKFLAQWAGMPIEEMPPQLPLPPQPNVPMQQNESIPPNSLGVLGGQ